MARIDDISDKMADMGIDEAENAELFFEEEVEDSSNKFETCLVGRFLTERGLNVRAMKSKIADIWRPARGINIKDLKPNTYLFQFYHMDDMEWVLNGGPWTFDGAMLVLNTIGKGEDPLEVPLVNLQFWVQLYGIPSSLMTEAAGKQLGNFFGSFISYDPNNNTSIWRECMRIRISIDVRQPLKRKKKINRRNGTECIVQCKYERLGDLCFICGHVTHTERFCIKKSSGNNKEELREWGVWLRAPARKSSVQDRSKFLRDERDPDWDENQGKFSYNQHLSRDHGNQYGQTVVTRRIISNAVTSHANNQGFKYNGKDKAILETNFKNPNGPTEEELTGLNIEEGNKRRRGPEGSSFMEIEGTKDGTFTETGFSSSDGQVSSNHDLAKLARQASHSQ